MTEPKDALKRYFTEHHPVGPEDFPIFGRLVVGNLTFHQLSRKLLHKGMHPNQVNDFLREVRVANSVKTISLICAQPLDVGISKYESFDTIAESFRKRGLSFSPRETPFRGFIAAAEDFVFFPRRMLDFKERKTDGKKRGEAPTFFFSTEPVTKTIKTHGRTEINRYIFGVSVVDGSPCFKIMQANERRNLFPPDTFFLFQRK